MAIFGYFWGQNSYLDPLEGPQSGFWAQISLVGGPGVSCDISGCSRTFLDISLALSGPFRVPGETPKMAILGYFWGQNNCLDPLEGLPSGFGHRYRLWVVLGLCGTYLGVIERFSVFLWLPLGLPTCLARPHKLPFLGRFGGQNSCLTP
jgi:hypothetical protein